MNIGIVGGLGAGKTTGADYLVQTYGYQKKSLAAPIKTMLNDILDINKTHPKFREAAQDLGSFFRKYDSDCWVSYLLNNMLNQPIVVDDVRFKNEVLLLLNSGFKIIYLDCPQDVRVIRCLKRDHTFDERSLAHISETGIQTIPTFNWYQTALKDGNCYQFNSNVTMGDFTNLIDLAYCQLKEGIPQNFLDINKDIRL
jgi:dephospho-CoA kinase